MKNWLLAYAYQRDRQRLVRGAGMTTSGTPVVTGCATVMTGATVIVPVGVVFVIAGWRAAGFSDKNPSTSSRAAVSATPSASWLSLMNFTRLNLRAFASSPPIKGKTLVQTSRNQKNTRWRSSAVMVPVPSGFVGSAGLGGRGILKDSGTRLRSTRFSISASSSGLKLSLIFASSLALRSGELDAPLPLDVRVCGSTAAVVSLPLRSDGREQRPQDVIGESRVQCLEHRRGLAGDHLGSHRPGELPLDFGEPAGIVGWDIGRLGKPGFNGMPQLALDVRRASIVILAECRQLRLRTPVDDGHVLKADSWRWRLTTCLAANLGP